MDWVSMLDGQRQVKTVAGASATPQNPLRRVALLVGINRFRAPSSPATCA